MSEIYDHAFWQTLIQRGYAVPDDKSAADLTPHLLELLGSPDPTLRDGVAYEVLANWIIEKQLYTPDELRDLLLPLKANLLDGIGEVGRASVLKRSFSVLVLSLIAYYDVHHPFLRTGELRDLLDAALEYLDAEKDVPGYVPDLGWLHAVAHTADLLKFLARNPLLDGGDHLKILTGIAAKLAQPQTHVYIHDEDERLTMAVLDVLKRGTLSPMVLNGWLEGFREWKRTMPSGAFDPLSHAPYLNQKNFLRSLYLTLQLLADKDETFKPVETEALRVVRFYGIGTIYAAQT